MTLSRVAGFPDTHPSRIRTGTALLMLQLLPPVSDDSFSQSLADFTTVAWQWVETGLKNIGLLYEKFEALHEAFTEIDGSQNKIGQAAFLGAYCVLWEVYSEAWDMGSLHSSELPSEICEGDKKLWREFAESLTSIEEDTTQRMERGLKRVLDTLRGNPEDRETRKSRKEIASLFGNE
jgi:hypothetical protein